MSPTQLSAIRTLIEAFPIEWAALRASEKQLRFARAFFAREHPETGARTDIFVAMGANRSGKSIVCGWLCFAEYLLNHAKDGDWFWCVAQTLDRSIGGQQQELWRALPRWMFGDQVWTEKLGFGGHRKIVLPTRDGGKCLVEFRSGDQDPSTFEQAKLTGVWADEKLPEAIYDRLIPRIVDRDGWILYSDIPEQWWQFERLKEAPPDAGVLYQHFTMWDNAHNLPPGAIEKASARMSEDERKLRIAGEFVVMEGVVYKEFVDRLKDLGGHLVEPFVVPADWPKWRLIDYGASAPTACLWVTIAPDERLYVYREYYQRNLSVAKNAQAILTLSGDEEYRTTYIDPHAFDPPPVFYGHSPTIADQYAAEGLACVPWPFVQVMGEHAMVQKVKYRLEHRTLWVYSSLRNTRREFRSWKYKCDEDGKPKAADAFEDDNNHTLDCIKGFLGTLPCHTQGLIEATGGDDDRPTDDD